MKRIMKMGIVITLIMGLITFPPQTASAATGWLGDNVSYTCNSGNLYISGSGPMYDYGAYDNESPIRNISPAVNNVTIAEGVTSIGALVFFDMGITSVSMPTSLRSISADAFALCTELTSLQIPQGVTSIGSGAFTGNTSLASITIPNSVTSIGNGAFTGCISLTSVVIPSSVTSIGDYAFSSCASLTSVDIPDSVTSMGSDLFDGCENPPAIRIYGKLGTGVNYILNRSTGHMEITGTGAMTDYSSSNRRPFYPYKDDVKTVSIANGITSIGNYAFEGCTSLTSVTIPSSVTSIGTRAFFGCASLTSVTIPGSVTSIGDQAFQKCSGLTSVTIPNSITNMGEHVFRECTSLTSVTIENGATSIGNIAFYECTSLASVVIPNSVTSIGRHAFYGCTSLTSVVIPSSVTSIGALSLNKTPQYYISTTAPTIDSSNNSTRVFGWTPLTITGRLGGGDNVQVDVNAINPLVSMKYAQGSRDITYFAISGTEFSTNTLSLSNGTYTFYTLDVGGNETIQTFVVAPVKTMTVKQVDEAGNPISSLQSAGFSGTTTSITAPSVAGYIYQSAKRKKVGVSGYTSITLPYTATYGTDEEIVMTYKKNVSAITVNINYSDKTKESFVIDDVIQGTTSYVVNAPAREGYTVSNPSQTIATVGATHTINFTYTKITGNIRVRAVEKSTGNLIKEIGVDKAYGSHTITTSELGTLTPVNGWKLSSGESTSKSVSVTSAASTAVVTFNYDKQMGSISIKAMDGASQLSTDSDSAQIGTSYTAGAPDVAHYRLSNTAQTSKTITVASTNTISFDFKRISSKIFVKCRDKTTGKIIYAEEIDKGVGTSYTLTSPTITGYSYHSGSLSGTVAEGGTVVVLDYNPVMANVKVIAYDEKNNVIFNETRSYQVGSSVTIPPPQINGYDWTSTDGASGNASFTIAAVASTNADVKFRYSDIDNRYVSAIVKGMDGTTELYSYTVTAERANGNFNVEAFAVPLFRIKPATQSVITVTASGNRNQNVTFQYETTITNVTIKTLLSGSGAVLKPQFTVATEADKPFSYNAPHIDGYSLVSQYTQNIASVNSAGTSTLTFNYQKNEGNITILAKERGTSKVIGGYSATLESGGNRTFTTSDAPSIEGYTLYTTGTQPRTFDGMTALADVVYEYTKNTRNVVIEAWDVVTETKIPSQDTSMSARTLEAFTKSAKSISGYSPLESTISGLLPAGTGNYVVKAWYKPVTSGDLSVRAIRESDGSVIQTTAISGLTGESHTIHAPVLEGWTLASDELDEKTSKIPSVVEFRYDPIQYNVSVSAKDTAGNNLQLPADYASTQVYNHRTPVNIYAPYIDTYFVVGYKVDGGGLVEGSVYNAGEIYNAFAIEWVFEHMETRYVTVTVSGIDEHSNELYSYSQHLTKSDVPVDIEALDVPKYRLAGGQSQTTPVVPDYGKAVYINYVSNMTTVMVYAFYEDSTDVVEGFTPFAVTAEGLKPFAYTAPNISGHTVVGSASKSVDTVAVDGSSELKFYYKRNTGNLQISCIDSVTGTVIGGYSRTLTTNETVVYQPSDAPEIEGYTLVTSGDQSRTYDGVNACVDVVYEYLRNTRTVIVEPWDRVTETKIDGYDITSSGVDVMSVYSVSAVTITDYSLIGSSAISRIVPIGTEPYVIQLWYQPDSNEAVSVKCVWFDDGVKKEIYSYSIPSAYGEEVLVPAPTLQNWRLADGEDVEVTVSSPADVEFVFEKDMASMSVTAATTAGEALPLPVDYDAYPSVQKGEYFSVFAPYIDNHFVVGYKLDGGELITSSVCDLGVISQNHSIEWVFEHMETRYVTVTVYGVDEHSNELYSYSQHLTKSDVPVDIEALIVPKYRLAGGQNQTTSVVPDVDKAVYINYISNMTTVTINAYLTGTSTLPDGFTPFTVTAEGLTPFAYTSPGISGYTVEGASTLNIGEVAVDGSSELVFNYKRNTGNIQIRCVDSKTGETISGYSEVLTTNESKTYQPSDAPVIEGYTLVTSGDQSRSYDGVNACAEVVYEYVRNTRTVVVEPWDRVTETKIEGYDITSSGVDVMSVYNVSAVTIPGYSLIGSSAISKIIPIDTEPYVIQVWYQPDSNETVSVKCVWFDDGVKKEIYSYNIPSAYGENVRVPAPTLQNWRLADGENSEVDVSSPGSVEFVFEKDMATIAITATTTGGEAVSLPAEYNTSPSIQKGEYFSVIAPYIDTYFVAGYKLDGGELITGSVCDLGVISQNHSIEWVFDHMETRYVTVTVYGVDELDNELYSYIRHLTKSDVPLNIEALDVPKYRLAEGQAQIVSVTPDADKPVYIEYVNNMTIVTIKAYHEDTLTPLEDFVPFTVTAEGLMPFAYSAPSISGYTVEGASTKNIVEVAVDGSSEIRFYYKRNTGNVQILCVDSRTGETISGYSESLSTNETKVYQPSDAPEIEGYTLVTNENQSRTFDGVNACVGVVYEYLRNTRTVVVESWDRVTETRIEGYDISSEGVDVLDVYTETALLIPGYSLIGSATISKYIPVGNGEFTFRIWYQPDSSEAVTVKCVWVDNGIEKEIHNYSIPAAFGEDVRVTAPILKNWRLAGGEDSVEDVTAPDMVKFVYEKDMATITTSAITSSGDALALPAEYGASVVIQKGEYFSVFAPYIDTYFVAGYKLDGGELVKSSVCDLGVISQNHSIEWVFEHMETRYVTVTISGVDEHDNELYRFSQHLTKSDEAVAIEALDVPKYRLADEREQTLAIVPDIDKAVYINYISNMTTVTIHAFYEDSVTVVDGFVPFTVVAEGLKPLVYTAPNISGHTVEGLASKGVDTVAVDGSSEIVFNYKRNTGNLQILCIDSQTGGTINGYSQTLATNETKTYQPSDAPAIEGYTLATSGNQARTFDGVDVCADVVYEYLRNTRTVLVEPWDRVTETKIEGYDISSEGIDVMSVYRESAVTIPGYSLVGVSELSRIVPLGEGIYVIQLWYQPDSSEAVSVKCVWIDDGVEKEIHNYSIPAASGENVRVAAPTLKNWMLADGVESSSDAVAPDTVKFVYEKDMATMTITAITSSGDALALPAEYDTSPSIQKGEYLSVTAPYIDTYFVVGYKVDGGELITGSVCDLGVISQKHSVEWVFEHMETRYVTITVSGVDEHDNELYSYSQHLTKSDEAVPIEALSVPKYRLAEGQGQSVSVIPDIDKTVYITYISNMTTVTVYAFYEDSTEMVDGFTPITLSAEGLMPFTCSAPSIDGHTVAGSSSKSIDTVAVDGSSEIVFNYKRNVGNLQILCVDARTGETINGYSQTLTTNETRVYQPSDAPVIEGYTLVTTEEQPRTFDGVNVCADVVYEYVRNTRTVIVEPWDSVTGLKIEGNDIISPDVEVMSVYSTSIKSIAGYNVIGATTALSKIIPLGEGAYVIQVWYQPDSSEVVSVKCVWFDDGVEKEIHSFGVTAAFGELVTVTAPVFRHWKPAKGTEATVSVTAPNSVKFVYEKDMVNVSITAVTALGVKLPLPVEYSAVVSVQKGEHFTAYAPHINGYVVLGDSVQSFKDILEDLVITFTYGKPGVVDLNVKMIDYDTEEVILSEILSGIANESVYTYYVKDLSSFGYIFASSIPESTKSGTVSIFVSKESANEIILKYKQGNVPVVTRYVDFATGKDIAEPTTSHRREGTVYTANPPDIAGYAWVAGTNRILVSADETQNVLILKYVKSGMGAVMDNTGAASVYVRHVTETAEGDKSMVDLQVIEGVTSTYTYNPEKDKKVLDIKSRGFAVKNPEPVTVNVLSGENVITVGYEPQQTTIDIQYIDVGSGDVLLTAQDTSYVGVLYVPKLHIFTGYSFVGFKPTNGIEVKLSDNVVDVLLANDSVNAYVKYVELKQDGSEELIKLTGVTGSIGEVVQHTAPVELVENQRIYRLEGDEHGSITIDEDQSKNVLIFYYKDETPAEEPGDGTDEPGNGTDKPGNGTDKPGNGNGYGGGGGYSGGYPNPPDNPTGSGSAEISIGEVLTADAYVAEFKEYFGAEFSIKDPATRAEIAVIFSELFIKEAVNDDFLFSDVSEDWYRDAVEDISRKGIMIGYPEGTFRPDAQVTRAEISAVIARTMEYIARVELMFPDLPNGHWAEDYISRVNASGIMIGDTAGTFRPDEGISREEVIIVVNRLRGFDA